MKNWFFLILGCLAWPALAQMPKSLALPEAIQLAESNNADWKASLLNAALTKEDSRVTQGLYLPTLTGSLELRNNSIRPTSILPGELAGRPGQTIPVQFGTEWQHAAGLTLSQKVFDRTLKTRSKTDALNAKLADSQIKQAKRDLAYTVKTRYYQALLDASLLGFYKTQLDRQEALVSFNQNRLAEGRALSTDLTQALINRDNSRLDLQLAYDQAIVSKYNLVSSLATDTTGAFALMLTTPLNQLNPSEAPPQKMDFARRPEYLQEQIRQELSLVNAQNEEAKKLPTINLNAYLGSQGFSNSLGKSFNVGNNWYGNAYLALNMSMPIINGYERSAKIKQEQIKAQQSQLKQSQLLSNWQAELKSIWRQYQDASLRLSLREKNKSLAAQNLQQVMAKFAEGRALYTEVLAAEETTKQAEADWLRAQFNLLKARLELEKLVDSGD